MRSKRSGGNGANDLLVPAVTNSDLTVTAKLKVDSQIWEAKPGVDGEDFAVCSPNLASKTGSGWRGFAIDLPNLANQTGVDGEDYVTIFPSFGKNNPLTEETRGRKSKGYLLTLDCAKGEHKGPGARAPGPVLPSIGLCPPYATLAPSQRRGKCWRLPTCTRTPPRDHGNTPPTWPFALPSCTCARRSEALRRAPEPPRLPE